MRNAAEPAMTSETCYMCEEAATSREHVPPKCIFPEKKDLGEDLRQDLITVPSCRAHNTRKSQDDEFLLVCLAGIFGNNSIGYRHKFTKVERALRRTSGLLIEKVFRTKVRYPVQLEGNQFLEVIYGTPDLPRLERCLDHIVRALHFHQFQEKFEGTITTLFSYLTPSQSDGRELYRLLKDHAEMDLVDSKRHGRNQDVFYYQVTEPDKFGLRLFHTCFYGGVSIYSALVPSGIPKPFDLALSLAMSGLRTTINLGGRSYEFNQDDGEGQA